MKNSQAVELKFVPRTEPRFTEHSIQETREWKGLTRTELAKIVGISPSTLKSYEEYKTSPSLYVGYLIAEALGCTINEICWSKPTKA